MSANIKRNASSLDPFRLGLRKSFLYRAEAVFLGRMSLYCTYFLLWLAGLFSQQENIFPTTTLDLLLILCGFLYAQICYHHTSHRRYGRRLHFITLILDLILLAYFSRTSFFLLSPLMAIHPLLMAAFLLAFHNPWLMVAPLTSLLLLVILTLTVIPEIAIKTLMSTLLLYSGLDILMIFFIHLPHSKEHRLLRSMVTLEKKLKELAVIKERQRIAREFHDGVGAKLASIVLQCDYLNQLSKKNTEAPENLLVLNELAEIKESAIESIDDMRRSISFLNGNFEITEQIDIILEKTAQRHRINIYKYGIDLLKTLNNEQQIACCRIIQESLTNALKHAQAQIITLAISKTETGIKLSIKDDGIGFETSLSKDHHFGMRNMGERAKLIGANLSHHSKLNGGTEIVLEISLAS